MANEYRGNGETWEGGGGIMLEILATNFVASRQPERRPLVPILKHTTFSNKFLHSSAQTKLPLCWLTDMAVKTISQ